MAPDKLLRLKSTEMWMSNKSQSEMIATEHNRQFGINNARLVQ